MGACRRVRKLRGLLESRASRLVMPFVAPTVATCAYSAWSIERHDRFATRGFDLGIFDQTIWGYSRFEIVPNTIKRTSNLLGDHFHPLLMSLAPSYWLWDDVRVLLVDQALLIAIASVPIFLVARARIGVWPAVGLQAAFLLSWPVLAAVSFDFHEVSLAAPLLSWSLFAAYDRRNVLLWLLFPLALLVREDVALAYVGIALYLIVSQRRYRLGFAIASAGLLWIWVVTKLIVPAIAGHSYGYWAYGALGDSAIAIAAGIVARPWEAVVQLVNSGMKIKTLLLTVGAWAFIPAISPIVLVAIPLIAERFWSTNDLLWGTTGQYSLLLAPVMSFAAIDGIARLQSTHARVARALPVLVLSSAIALTFVVVRPARGMHPMIGATRAKLVEQCLRLIPPSASVAASDVFISHLSHRKAILPLFARRSESYLAIDLSDAVGHRALRNVLASKPPAYEATCYKGETIVLRRVS
jgi:uncharacterized membrane protein